MAKIATFSADYKLVRQESAQMGEHHDCGVVAMAILTGKPYAEVHAALAAAGRKARKGTYYGQFEKAAETLGFSIKKWTFMEMNALKDTYPGRAKTLKNLTVNHIRRYPAQWATQADKALLLFTRGHVSAYKAGQVHDWADGKAKQIVAIWELTPR